MKTKLRVKWLAQIKVKAKKEDMSQEVLDKILDQYGLTKFPKEKVWQEAEKVKSKWKRMSTAQRTRWTDDMHDIAKKAHTSDADVEAILDDFGLKIKEEVEMDEGFQLQATMALDDEGIKSKWKKGKLYVAKKDIKKAEKALGKSFKKMKKGAEPDLYYEEVELDEKGTAYPATVDTLRKIVKDKQHQTVMFKSGQALVDLFTASAIIAVYDGMKKPELKKKLEDMIKSKEGFLKTQSFAMKMVK